MSTVPPMSGNSSDVKVNVTRLAVPLAVLTAVIALAGAWVLLPYRVEAVEKKTEVLEQKFDAQQQLVIRIDENIKELLRNSRRRETP